MADEVSIIPWAHNAKTANHADVLGFVETLRKGDVLCVEISKPDLDFVNLINEAVAGKDISNVKLSDWPRFLQPSVAKLKEQASSAREVMRGVAAQLSPGLKYSDFITISQNDDVLAIRELVGKAKHAGAIIIPIETIEGRELALKTTLPFRLGFIPNNLSARLNEFLRANIRREKSFAGEVRKAKGAHKNGRLIAVVGALHAGGLRDELSGLHISSKIIISIFRPTVRSELGLSLQCRVAFVKKNRTVLNKIANGLLYPSFVAREESAVMVKNEKSKGQSRIGKKRFSKSRQPVLGTKKKVINANKFRRLK